MRIVSYDEAVMDTGSFSQGVILFKYLDAALCGTIEGFKECDIGDVSRKALKDSKFQMVSGHSLELFGKCKKCAKA